ncbi:MAG: hypothetical protein IJX06_04865 [Clostridia bacterium]|nr:hypothetical protein [Clostridia bacterium]
MKKIIKFIKRNVFSCTCFLLAIAVCLTGTFSYARYISVDSYDRSPGAGSFSCSANIDKVSALSFTNTAFWGGTVEDDKIAMNALRSVDFNVKNWEVNDGVEKVAEVKMKYNLVFSSPVNFAEKLAIQVFDADANVPLLPQIVVSDLINAGGGVFDTGDSEDYNGTDIADMKFSVVHTTNGSGNDVYRATNGDISISIEEYERDVHQTLLFRMWDSSALTDVNTPTLSNEGGKLLPHLTVRYTQDIYFYRITVSMPDFILEPGTKKERNHRIQLAPTDTIQDTHLGGSIVKNNGDGTYSAVKSIYADNQTWTVQTVHEKQTDHYLNTDFPTYDAASDAQKEDYCVDEKVLEYNVMGSPKIYNVGDTLESAPVTYQSKVEDNTPGAWGDPQPLDEDVISPQETITNTVITYENVDSWNNTKWTNSKGRSNNTESTPAGNRRLYVYEVDVTKVETVVETTVKSIRKRVASSVTTTNKDVSETIEVKSVSAGQQNIELNVTKTTKTKTSIVNNIETQTIKTITTKQRTTKGTVYKAFYRQTLGNGNTNNTYRHTQNDHVEYTGPLTTVAGYKLNDFSASGTPTETTISTKTEPYGESVFTTETPDPVSAEPITEHIKRYINRSFNHSDIIIEGVEWAQRDAAGNAIYIDGVLQVDNYTESNPLELYRQETEGSVTKDVQHYYLAKCYSKNYPFYVNVVFEQIQ